MTQPKGLFGRIDHGWSGHSWASRDWQDIDCNAIGCLHNRDRKCLMPSLAVIGSEGRCLGFTAKISSEDKP